MKKKKGLLLVALLIGIPLIVFSVLQRQDTRQRASTPTYAPSIDPNKIGIAAGDVLTQLNEDELNAYFDDAKSLGVKWIRFDFNWAEIQAGGRTSYDWSKHYAIVNAAYSRGIKVVGVLSFTPNWALPYGCTDTNQCAPSNPADFAAFANAAAAHFAPLGVHHWEIWNEPNGGTFTPETYSVLLKATYPAIKNADYNAFVLAGGSMPAATSGKEFSPTDFLQGMYTNEAKEYFDALAHHPYCWSGGPTFDCPITNADWSAWTQLETTGTNLRSIMTANGDANKQIWGTEFGAPTGGGPSATPETQQAKSLTDAYTLWNAFSWGGPLFWYQYRDKCNDAYDVECFFGLIRFDGTHKPAYDAFKDLTTIPPVPSETTQAYAAPTETPMPEPTSPYITPFFNCLGPCPTLPDAEPYYPTVSPTLAYEPTGYPSEYPTEYPSVYPTDATEPPTAYPSEYPTADPTQYVTDYPTAAVSEAPCEYGTTLAHDKGRGHGKHHKKHHGHVSNGMSEFMKFLIDLINQLLALIGGAQIPTPAEPQVTQAPAYPSAAEEPTEAQPTDAYPSSEPNPCPEPTSDEPTATPIPYYEPTQAVYPTVYPTKYVIPTIKYPTYKNPYKKSYNKYSSSKKRSNSRY